MSISISMHIYVYVYVVIIIKSSMLKRTNLINLRIR